MIKLDAYLQLTSNKYIMKKLYILFAFLSVFYMNAQVIVIDPGHGYGSTTSNNPDTRTATEIETSLAVGLKTRTLIQNSCPSLTVQMTRSTNLNGWISVTQRAQMSNNWNADRLLSIHCNAGGGTGTETFYCTYDDSSTATDIAFSKKIQADMVSNGAWNDRRCVEDASFLAYHLGVLRYSSATACLSEIGFVDTSSDAAKLNSDTWRNKFALSYFNSFKASLNTSCAAVAAPGSFSLTATPECVNNTPSINLTWTASANASTYDIYRNGALYSANLSGTSFSNTYVTSGTSYTYYVKAKNATGSVNNSNGTLARTASCGLGAFTLTATPICTNGTSAINLSWTASSGATSYDIYRNGSLYTNVTSTAFSNTYVTTGTTYTYYVIAKNASSSVNNSNGTLSRTASCAPGSFTVTTTATCSGSMSAINVTWTTSANATAYDIYRNGTLYATDVTGNSFLNTYLINPGTSYTFSMVAKNTSGTLANSNGNRTATGISCAGRKSSGLENTFANEILLYPNPSSDFINLQISEVNASKFDVNIFDINGRFVKKVEIHPSQNTVEQKIDISSFSSGTYFMNGVLDNKEFVKKFIKN